MVSFWYCLKVVCGWNWKYFDANWVTARYLFRPEAKCTLLPPRPHAAAPAVPVRSKNPGWTRYGLAAGDGWEEEGEQQVKTREMPTFISPCCCILSFLQACWSPGMHDSQVLLWQNISNSGTNALSFKFTANVSAKIDQTSFCKIKSFKRESTSAL